MNISPGAAPDQYHAFTTRLSAAGYQTVSQRVIAGCIVALAIPALLAGTAPKEVPWSGFRLAYMVIAVACLGLAVPWLRYRWPTRRQSATVVVIGTVTMAAGCLTTIDPMAGMVITTSFTFLLGLTALFHSSRLLAFVAATAGITLVVTAARIARTEISAAIALAIPVLLLFVVITFACRTVVSVGASDAPRYELDPLTGFLTREAFYAKTSTVLGARHREEDRYFIVAVVDVDGFAAIAGMQGSRGTDQAQLAAASALRETIRRDAVVGRCGDGEFLIADIFTISDPAPLIERVRGAIAATPSRITASIGVVSTPLGPLISRPPDDVLDDLIALASAAMQQARSRGGNQSRYVLDPESDAQESDV